MGGRISQFVLLEGTSSGNLLGAFYRQLSMGRKETIFWGENQTSVGKKAQNKLHIYVHGKIYV